MAHIAYTNKSSNYAIDLGSWYGRYPPPSFNLWYYGDTGQLAVMAIMSLFVSVVFVLLLSASSAEVFQAFLLWCVCALFQTLFLTMSGNGASPGLFRLFDLGKFWAGYTFLIILPCIISLWSASRSNMRWLDRIVAIYFLYACIFVPFLVFSSGWITSTLYPFQDGESLREYKSRVEDFALFKLLPVRVSWYDAESVIKIVLLSFLFSVPLAMFALRFVRWVYGRPQV